MNNYSTDLLDFLNASPVNFFAVKEIARRLEAKGYKRINAEDTARVGFISSALIPTPLHSASSLMRK